MFHHHNVIVWNIIFAVVITIIMCCWTWSRCKRKKKSFVQKSIFYGEFVKKQQKTTKQQQQKKKLLNMLYFLWCRFNKILFIEVNVFTVTRHVKIYGSKWVSDIKMSHDFFCPLWLLLHRNREPRADALLMACTDSRVWVTLLKHSVIHNVNYMLRPTKSM